jgi:hypothetical protein
MIVMDGRFTKVQWLLMVTTAVFIVMVAIEEVNGLHARTSYTCLQCRAELRKERWLGVPTSQILENDCSRWYAKDHPAHRHEWCWCGGETTRYLTGKMWSCGRQHPIWDMPPDMQLEFMRTAQAKELDAFWQTMKSASREDQQAVVTKVVDKALDAK